jgi:adenylate kinase
MDDGGLVSDSLTIEIVKDRLSQPDCQNGAVLDGFPRTEVQARALDQLLADTFKSSVALAPLFVVSREVTTHRIQGRARHEGRADDAPAVADKRFDVYQQNIEPLVDYYRAKGLLATIDAGQNVDQVTAQIIPLIEQRVRGA